jgi:hypothetical protein
MYRRMFCTLAVAAVAVAFVSEAKAARYPRMVAALGEMKQARKELHEAATDFGGHKVKALEALEVAIEQMDKALRAVGIDPVYVPPSPDVYKSYRNYPYMVIAFGRGLARTNNQQKGVDTHI